MYRIYRELELNLRIKPRQRLARKTPQPSAVPEGINQVWSMDFMHDQLGDGRSFRLFNVIDDFYREGVATDVKLSLPASRVIRPFEQFNFHSIEQGHLSATRWPWIYNRERPNTAVGAITPMQKLAMAA